MIDMKVSVNKVLKELMLKRNITCLLVVVLTMAFLISGYEEDFVSWYDDHIMPILSAFKSNVYSIILLCVLIVVIGGDICRKWKNRFKFDYRWTLALSCCLFCVIWFRFSGRYEYVKWIWTISYVDVLVFAGLCYCCISVVNAIKIAISNNHQFVGVHEDGIIRDWPIETKTDDIFDLSGEAKKIANEILELDKSKTWSLAITAQWGAGKTSFLNLIKENFTDKDIEVVYFNPRDCKSYQKIQEDFFSMISCTLSKYDGRCSGMMKDYMSSLQLIDNRSVVEKLVSLYKIWNKEGLKDKLKQSFGHIDKKILVLIDDFDRLSKEEILEVLKLIDSNAAFANLVFLTAYDKTQVNKTLGESYQSDDACFVDKFFNLEFSVPFRSYSYITHYIGQTLCNVLDAKNHETLSIKQTLKNREDLLKEYLPTLRDAKRFINQFSMDYRLVRGDVNLDEYVMVQLIKYKYKDEYLKLFRKIYIESKGFFSNQQLYYLKQDIDGACKIKPLLEKLFPRQKEKNGYDSGYSGESYKRIFDVQSFDNYFVNQIYGSMRIQEMESAFYGEIQIAYSRIDEWICNDNQLNDFIAYLYNFDMDKFNNDVCYLRFTDLVTYLAVKKPNTRAYWLFLRLIYLSNLDGYDKKYNLDFEDYKKRLLDAITDISKDDALQLIRRMHYSFRTFEMKDDEELIKDSDIWPIIKNQFINTIQSCESEDSAIEWLYQCVDHLESPSRKIILDGECLEAYKKRIMAYPEAYVRKFVRLGYISSSVDFNSIACEPFWEQIFDNAKQFEIFVSKCETASVEKIGVVRNFWNLYEANNYKPIEFEDQGNVQDKIDKGLELEVTYLKHLRKIQQNVSEIPDVADGLSAKDKQNYQEALRAILTELNEVKLYISLNGDIRKEIESKLEIMK